jgi:hypothetical protein
VGKFSHKLHILEEELECGECHGPIIQSENLNIIRSFSLTACEDCHDEDPVYDTTFTFVVTDTGFPVQYSFRPGSLKFSHKMHNEEKVDCDVCHGKIKEKWVKKEEFQNMRACMDCHDEKSDNSCFACHYETEMPKDHVPEFWVSSQGHAKEANFREQDCNMCHQQNTSCAECHMGADGRQIHDLNYRYTHGIDVIFKTSDCSVCHQPERFFCGDCHERMGIHVDE